VTGPTATGPLPPPGTTARTAWLALAAAVVSEVAATLLLKASAGFTVPVPAAASLVGYAAAVAFLSVALGRLPIGLSYAVWVGAGSVVVTVAGVVLFGETLNAPAVLGITLVGLGVVVANSDGGGT
jgi:small multidrug resistance pump